MAVAVMKRTRPGFHKEVAARAIFIIEQLKHSTGEWAGQPFKLMPWQRKPLEKFFGTLKADGTRQYRTLYEEIPRKNGKTEQGAGVGLYLLVGDNEPGAQIYSCAGDRGQASLIYNAAAPMVRQSPALWDQQGGRLTIVDSQKRIVYHEQNSFYQVLSAEAYSKHGLNVHGNLFDELHTQPDRHLWDVMRTGSGARRQPVTMVMTTAGFDRNSIAWEIHDYACKVRDGIIDDPTFLPVIYAAPDKADWTSETVWKKCNPALGVFRSIEDMRIMCRQAQEMPAFEMTFRRLYLNQWVNSVKRWLPIYKWDACNEPVDPETLKGRPCYGGLDLSSTIDLTALVLVFPRDDGGYDILPYFWIPEDTAAEAERRDHVPYREWARHGFLNLTPGNVIDYGFVRHLLRDIRAQFNLRELAYDDWNIDQLVQNLEDEEGFVSGTDKNTSDGPVLVPFRQGYKSLSPPTKELMTLTLQKKLRHGGHPVLRWNADNLVVKTDEAGNIKPDKAKATQKIDGMVALIMALDRAIKHKGDNGPSIYETRGVITI
jgi:phage terminase large subunit-like protein